MSNPFDFFQKIYYINLDSRPDRREHIENLFKKYNIQAERFPAITLTHEQNEHLRQDGCIFRGDERSEHARYTKSCSLSHLSIILRAKLMGYKNVLIFEDDVIFHEDIIEKLSKSIEDLKQQERWDMFYIGCNPFQYRKLTDNLGQCLGALCAHAYAVNYQFYDTILNIPFKQVPSTDVYYLGLSQHNPNNINRIYMALENLAWQIPSYSTLEETEVNYYPSIQFHYNNNMID